MEIRKEDTGNLNAVIRLNISKDDYITKVEEKLKEYRRKAAIPGFRQGKVPIGMIRKMYGTAVKANEINDMISYSLREYIVQNNVKILGEPLPQEDEKLDIANQDDFEILFDIGLAPDFTVPINSKSKFTRYVVQPDDELISTQIKDLCKRHGQVTPLEASQEDSMLYGEFSELDAEGNLKEGGVRHKTTISCEYVEDDATKTKLLGLKNDDAIICDPKKVSKGDTDLAAMLGITKEKIEDISSTFQFKVLNIYSMAPAEVNQELFDKVFGKDVVKDEPTFKEKIHSELQNMLKQDSKMKLKKDIIDFLIKKLDPQLPDEFLKRWLLKSSKNGLTEESLENEYDEYTKSIKWQLIQEKIVQENDIKVEEAEALARVKENIIHQMSVYGQQPIEDQELLDKWAAEMLNQKEDLRGKTYEQLYDEKMTQLFESNFSIKDKEITYSDFVELLKNKPSRFKLFDKVNNILNLGKS